MSAEWKCFSKIDPFKYPTAIHKRTLTPPSYNDYRKYKPYLKAEFANHCVYCRAHDLDQDTSSFHVEHYRPKSLFPELESRYTNLFYSCASCNRFKKNYWSDSPSKQVPNPCDTNMSEHLVFDSHFIKSRSSMGLLAVELLRLNNDEALRYREAQRHLLFVLVESAVQYRKKKSKHKNRLERICKQIARLSGNSPERVNKVLKV